LSIDPEPASLTAKFNEPLTVAFRASGGSEPYRWSPVGTLPRGLSLDSRLGELSGTPLVPGITSVKIRLRDSKGFEALRVVPLSVEVTPLQIAAEPETAPAAMAGLDFSWSLALAGGVPPYSVKPAQGSALPKGLAVSTRGASSRISGVPQEAGDYSFVLEASDSRKNATPLPLELRVAPYDLTIPESVAAPLAGKYNEDFAAAFSATGGKPPYSWSIQGKLPTGLRLDPAKGTLSGKPSTVGKFPFTLKVIDGNSLSASTDTSVEITAAPLRIAPEPAEAPAAVVGLMFVRNIAVEGGVPPYSLRAAPDTTLPEGLSVWITGTTGKLAG
jgi:hypothetical protein